MAFPISRGVCLTIVGKLLGDSPQGTWMGIMFALGAVARVVGSFWAVQGLFSLGPLVVFGSTSALFCAALLTVGPMWWRLSSAPLVRFKPHSGRTFLFEDIASLSPRLGSPRIPHYHPDPESARRLSQRHSYSSWES